MKKNLLLVFFVSLCLACNSQSQKNDTKASGLSLNITGKLNNAVAGKVYLEKMNERNIATKIDSSATSSNAFSFKTTIPEPGIYQLNVADQQIIGLILDGGENLTVTADGVATPEKAATFKVEGSKTMDKFNEIMTQMQQFGQARSVLEGKFQAAKTEKDREAIRKEYQAAELSRGQAVLPKIKELGTSMAGIIAANNFLNPETDGQYMMELVQKLKDEGKNHFYANIFIQEVNRKSIGTIGTPAPDFELVDLNGKKVKLSDQKGKTVIIDFWATWCGPCISSFPGMKMAIDKYKDNPKVVFLFVNTFERVPQDNWKDHVNKFVTQRGYAYLNPILDFNNQTAISYGVEGIPAKFCIDKDGKFKNKSAGYLGSSQAVYDEMVKWVEEGE
jgi:thiol-disulfide isomerase/thioredoxin